MSAKKKTYEVTLRRDTQAFKAIVVKARDCRSAEFAAFDMAMEVPWPVAKGTFRVESIKEKTPEKKRFIVKTFISTRCGKHTLLDRKEAEEVLKRQGRSHPENRYELEEIES